MKRYDLKFRIDPHGGADINYAEYDIWVDEILSVRVKINPKECLVIRTFKLKPYLIDFTETIIDTYVKGNNSTAMSPDVQYALVEQLADTVFLHENLVKMGFNLV